MVADSGFDRAAHAVQFYDADDGVLIANVSRYLADGYAAGASLCMLATEPRRVSLFGALEGLGIDTARATDDGRLVGLDAEETLRSFMVDGLPDASRFEDTCGARTRALLEQAGSGGLRAYGEMVDLLWRDGKTAAAVRLEQLWDELSARVGGFALFCSYGVDIFGEGFDPQAIEGVLCTHKSVVPSGDDDRLHQSISTAMAHVLGVDVTAQILPEITAARAPAWGALPRGETMILQLRKLLPERAGKVLALARDYYEVA